MNREEFVTFIKATSREVQTWPAWTHNLVSHVPILNLKISQPDRNRNRSLNSTAIVLYFTQEHHVPTVGNVIGLYGRSSELWDRHRELRDSALTFANLAPFLEGKRWFVYLNCGSFSFKLRLKFTEIEDPSIQTQQYQVDPSVKIDCSSATRWVKSIQKGLFNPL